MADDVHSLKDDTEKKDKTMSKCIVVNDATV